MKDNVTSRNENVKLGTQFLLPSRVSRCGSPLFMFGGRTSQQSPVQGALHLHTGLLVGSPLLTQTPVFEH